jgi:hypothetical protein
MSDQVQTQPLPQQTPPPRKHNTFRIFVAFIILPLAAFLGLEMLLGSTKHLIDGTRLYNYLFNFKRFMGILVFTIVIGFAGWAFLVDLLWPWMMWPLRRALGRCVGFVWGEIREGIQIVLDSCRFK